MELVERKNKYIVYSKDGKILLITSNKKVAQKYADNT